jgi:hypothetical protein
MIGGSLNFTPTLPAINLSSLVSQMPTVNALDLTDLLQTVSLQVDPTALTDLMSQTLADYLRFMLDSSRQDATNPNAQTDPTTPVETTSPSDDPSQSPDPSLTTSGSPSNDGTATTSPTATASATSGVTSSPTATPIVSPSSTAIPDASTTPTAVIPTATPTPSVSASSNVDKALMPRVEGMPALALPSLTQLNSGANQTYRTGDQTSSPLTPSSAPSPSNNPSTVNQPQPTASSSHTATTSLDPTASLDPAIPPSSTPTVTASAPSGGDSQPAASPDQNLPNLDLPTLPDANQISSSFADWFSQPDVRIQFQQRLAQTIDLDAVTTQVSRQINLAMQQAMQQALSSMMASLQAQMTMAMQSTLSQFNSQMSQAMSIDPQSFSDIFSFTMDPAQMTSLMMSLMNQTPASVDSNLKALGYATIASPSSIDIYPLDFQSKEQVLTILNGYNDQMRQLGDTDKVITYTDIVGTLMASVTDIISKISAVLVAFVSISLVVSSIMIGVITYISVLERKKEIGILRSLGASKRDVANVFNAETLIIGFIAGLLGVLLTVGLTLIANPIVYLLFGIEDIARLPILAALSLIGISMVLTLISGLIPSSAASRRDPVEALRSE